MTLVVAVLWWVLGAICGMLFVAHFAPHVIRKWHRELRDFVRERDAIQRAMEQARQAYLKAVEEAELRRAKEFAAIDEEASQLTKRIETIERTGTAYYDCPGCRVHVMVWAHPTVDLHQCMAACVVCQHPVQATHDDLRDEVAP